jgi:short-subunit dehydrogenase
MKSLNNKVVWITGASSGIGEATALQFAKEGVRLVLSARREEELQRVKDLTHLKDEFVMVLPMDMEKIDQFEQKVEQVVKKFGRIDILFNNAGISQRGDVLNSKMDVYYKLMNLNFFGVVALTKAVLPQMINQKSGHIAVTSSVAGIVATPLRSGYAASKFALHGFFDALRAEVYKHKIKVTIVCPGYINTDISVNALNTEGTKHGKRDKNQEKGISPQECGQRIVDAIKQEKSQVIIAGKEGLGVLLKRFFPKILERIIIKQAPK